MTDGYGWSSTFESGYDKDVYGEALIQRYDITDFPSYQELRRRGQSPSERNDGRKDNQNYQRQQNRNGDSGETENHQVSYSDIDSDGNKLTAEQKEFFKNSKVRDKNGKLLVVYHGTPNQFTVFKQRTAMGWGTGIYFTDVRSETAEYGDNVIEAYLNITNPYNADTMHYDSIGAENTKAYRDFDIHNWKTWHDEYDSYEEYKEDGMGVSRCYH